MWVVSFWDLEPTGSRRPERYRDKVRPGTGREGSLGCVLERVPEGNYPQRGAQYAPISQVLMTKKWVPDSVQGCTLCHGSAWMREVTKSGMTVKFSVSFNLIRGLVWISRNHHHRVS